MRDALKLFYFCKKVIFFLFDQTAIEMLFYEKNLIGRSLRIAISPIK